MNKLGSLTDSQWFPPAFIDQCLQIPWRQGYKATARTWSKHVFWSENGTFEPKICFIMFYLCLFHIILEGNMMIILVGTIWYHNVQSQMVWCHLEIIHIMRTGTALGPEYGYNVMTFLSCVVSSICQARVVIDCLMTLVNLILLCKAAIPATIQCINAKSNPGLRRQKTQMSLTPSLVICGSKWSDPTIGMSFSDQISGVDVPCIARTAQRCPQPIFSSRTATLTPKTQPLRQGACLCGRFLTSPKS